VGWTVVRGEGISPFLAGGGGVANGGEGRERDKGGRSVMGGMYEMRRWAYRWAGRGGKGIC
jgi:hypothetical protein